MVAMKPLIEMHNITKVYAQGCEPVHALKDLTLRINSGEYAAIMGQSGSGKSTLMNLIGCLDRPTSGEYLFDSKRIDNYSEDELAELRNAKIGFVFQQFNLLSQLTALENVMLPMAYAGMDRAARKERAAYVLGLVGLSDRVHHRPSQLSGGQQQRVSIARALANNPQLLLADEPTGALDSQTSREIMTLIEELCERGMTVVIVTHDAEIASYSRRQIKVKDGQIVADIAKSAV